MQENGYIIIFFLLDTTYIIRLILETLFNNLISVFRGLPLSTVPRTALSFTLRHWFHTAIYYNF